MNQVIDTIMNRRSVRFYDSKPISKQDIELIINSGNNAPSGGNSQDWRFVVVESDDIRNEMSQFAMPIYKKWIAGSPPDFQDLRRHIDEVSSDPIYYSAPVIIFVIGTGATSPLDCPMVCQNMMLAARSIGIGSCWTFFGQLAQEAPSVKAMLELKADEKIFGPIVLGYPKDGFPPAPEKRPPEVKFIK
jgi:nitroreductase